MICENWNRKIRSEPIEITIVKGGCGDKIFNSMKVGTRIFCSVHYPATFNDVLRDTQAHRLVVGLCGGCVPFRQQYRF